MTKELIEVNSSNVAALGFDAGVLTVKYKNNRTYQYHGVPETVYNEVLKAESVGQALAELVKGQYPTEPIKKEDQDDETENETAGDSEPDTDQGDAAETDEAGTETGAGTTAEGVDDESDTDTPSNAGEKQEAESGSVEQAEGTAPDESSEPAKEPGADTPASPDSASPDDGNDDSGPNLGVDADEDELEAMIELILKHFGGDGLEQVGVREDDGVIIFTVYKLDEDASDVPIEIITGTLLELYNHATTAPTGPEPELDQEPNEEQSENLNTLRDHLAKFEIDLQYERVEEKSGDRFWNLKTSIERDDRTLNYSTKIVENCTKDEAEAAAEEIIANFVKAE